MSASSLTVPEGATVTFGVSLSTAPTANVSVSTAWVSGDPDVSVSGGASLTFTPSNWNVPQNVTVSAAEDADALNGSAVLRSSAAGWTSADVTATEADNDAKIVLSSNSFGVTEDGWKLYTIALGGQPAGNVTVTTEWVSGDPDLVVRLGSSLTFGPSNWNVGQTASIMALKDADASNGTAVIRSSADGWQAADLTVTEAEIDRYILATPTALTVPEGGARTVAVTLQGQPSANVVVSASRSSGDTDLGVSGGTSLTFTPSNWNVPQNVTVTAAEDADTLNGSAVVHLSSSGWYSADVTVTEADNDAAGVVTSAAAMSVPEGGTSTVGVQLSSAPAGNVTVSTGWVSGDGDVSVSGGGSLTFTPSNWNVAQNVTVSAAEDVDAVNGVAVLRASAAGWASADVTVTEADNDARIVATPASLSVPEGASRTFAVTLAGQPAANVTVSSVWRGGDAALTISAGASLTFTPANWSVPQNVTVAAAEDVDAVNGSAALRCSATGWTSADVTATEVDNDFRLVLSPTTVSVPEGGSATYGVSLGGQPSADVTVTTAWLSGDAGLSVTGGASLTFTASNWNVPQLVTLSAAEDLDAIDGSAVFRSSAPGWGAAQTTADATANDVDNDAKLVVTPASLTVAEGGTNTFAVTLGGQPAGNVTVTTARVSGDTDLTVSAGASLTFTSANWNVPQNVTVAAAEDVDAINGSAVLRASATGWTSADVTATEADNDARLVVAPSTLSVPEGGSNTYTVALAGAPAGNVTVSTAWASGDTDLSVSSGASLTFTSANWSTPQSVTVAAAEDTDAVNGSAVLRSSASGWASADVTATEADNDLKVVATPTSVSVPEGGTSTFAVTLAGAPASNVTVTTVRVSGDTDVSVASGASLTFTSANWNVPQNVTLAAAEDGDAVNGSAVVRSSATGYTSADVTATEADNDARILVAPSTLSVAEGGSTTFTVALAGAPAANVVVSTAWLSGDADLTVSGGASLTFTSANWNVPQSVTVAAAEDADAINGSATLRASASGWTSADVTATEADNDAKLVVAPTSVSVPEGGTGTFAVTLGGQPAGNVTVAAARFSGDTDLAVTGGASLTFTSANWNVPQNVTVAAAEDVDATNGSAVVRVTATGWTSADVTATEVDNDGRLVATPTALNVAEGGSSTFALTLPGQPAGNVTVTTAWVSGDTDLTVSNGASLTFTSANWNVPQNVTVSAAEDADAINGSAVLRASASGWLPVDVTATEVDNDAKIVTSLTNFGVTENGWKNLTVALGGQPAGNVTVTTAWVSGDTDLTVKTGASLTFTPSNWNVGQTLSIAAAKDADAINGTAVFRASAPGWVSADLTVTEAEIDRYLDVSSSTVSVPEGGTNTFTVVLRGLPPANVVVNTAWLNGDADVSVASGANLTFTPANWNVPQTVTVAAAEDADAIHGNAVLHLSSTGWWSTDVTVTEVDNDCRLVLSPTSLSVPEGGSNSYGVSLAAAPAANVTVTTAWLSGDASLSVGGGASLTFTPSNWNVPQYVTIAAAEDADAINSSAVFRSSASGWASADTTADATATETDNDAKVVVTPASVSVPEGGSNTFAVTLGGQPATSVTVSTARASGDTDLTVTGGASLTFTTTNWNVPQNVTLAAAEDADAANGSAVFRASATGWTSADVTASEADNDARVLATPSALSVPEGGSNTFAVTLAAAPAANVTVSTAWASGDTDLTVSGGASLTFTPSNWSTAQNVTVAAAEDADAANGSAVIRASAPGWTSADVTATEVDNDLKLVVTPASVSVPEGGSATFAVTLAGAPSANVTVAAARLSGDSDLSVTGGASLTFTPANWNVPQNVTLAAAEDTDASNGSATVRVTATGWTSADVTATEADNDLRIVPSLSSFGVTENGWRNLTLALAGQPAANVTVTTAWLSGDADLTVKSGATLTFTPSNWNVGQTLSIAAAKDADASNGTAVFRASAPGWVSTDLAVNEADIDTYILVSSTTLAVPEGQANTFTVTLQGQPAANVTVAVGKSSGDADLTLNSSSSLSFTPANWNVPQTVKVAAAEDADVANGSAVFHLSASGWWSTDVTATEADNDLRLVASPAVLSVPEGGNATVALTLGGQPAAEVVVTTAWVSGDADLTVTGGASLTFTPANWNVPQTATITAADDQDAVDGSAVVRASASGWTAADVAATEADNDRVLTVTAPATIAAGGSGTVRVRLAGAPAANLSVGTTRTAGVPTLSVSNGGSLTFTPSNWNVAQTVTLTASTTAAAGTTATFAAQANGWTSGTGTITIAPSAGGSTGCTGSVQKKLKSGQTVTRDAALDAEAPTVWVTSGVHKFYQSTDADGRYAFGNLTPTAELPVTAACPGYGQAGATTPIVADTILTVPDIALFADTTDTTGAIKGRVFDSKGKAVNGASIRIASSDYSYNTNTDGFFVFVRLAPGDYQVTCDAQGESLSQTVNVPQARTRVQDFHLGNVLSQPRVSVTVDRPEVVVGDDPGLHGNAVPGAIGGNIDTYQWDFGDGSTSTPSYSSPNITHVYSIPGDFLATLIVTDTDGDVGTAWNKVHVLPLPTLTVTLDPPAAAAAGARWTVDSGANQLSGATVSNLKVGQHTVHFTAATGFTPPADQVITLAAAENRALTGTYSSAPGSVKVTLVPAGAVAAGARWTLDGGAPQVSDATLTDIAAGDHTVAFTAATGYNTPPNQTVTIGGGVTTTATGTYGAGLVATPTTITVPETGTATFAVRLNTQPAGDVPVTVAYVTGDTDLSVTGGAGLTFTTTNWNVDQTVTVSAAADADDLNGTALIRASSPGWTSVDVTASEFDSANAVVATPSSVSVPEGQTSTFGVKLSRQPAADVAVTVARLSGDTDLSVTGGASLTFTNANWNTEQTVTLAAAYDADGLDGTAVIRCSAASYATAEVTATEADCDRTIVPSCSSSFTVPEGGTTSVGLRLQTQPSGNVIVTIARQSGDTDLTVAAGATLTFTPANWNIEQQVTFAAAEDADDTNGTAWFTASASGWGTTMLGPSELDNERSLVVSPTAVSVPEGGTNTFTVKLSSQPAGDVSVAVARVAGDTDLTVGSPASAWSLHSTALTAYGVAVDAAGSLYVADYANNLLWKRDVGGNWGILGNLGSGLGHFSGLAAVAVDAAGQVFTAESDNQRVQRRDASGTWSVVCGAGTGLGQVSDPRGVAVDAAGNLYVTDLATHRLQKRDTAGTWTLLSGGNGSAVGQLNGPWGVAVDAAGAVYVADSQNRRVQKRDAGGAWTAWGSGGTGVGQFSLLHGVAVDAVGNVYVADSYNARVQKRDPSGTWTVISTGSGSGVGQFNQAECVAVDAAGVLYAGDSDGRIQRCAAGLTFTSTNWNTPQTVAVAAAEDADAIDGTATIRCSATGWQSADVAATEADNDRQFVVSSSSVTVPEGGTQTFGVHLASQPAGDVTVAVAFLSGDTDVSVTGGASLTFTSGNWNVDQTVTLAAAEDADSLNGTAMVRVSATGWASADVTATEADNDASLVVSPASVSVPEGGSNTFTVKLSNPPTSDVNVAVSRVAGDLDITAAAPATSWVVVAAQGYAAGQVQGPQGVAVDAVGNLYVADTNSHRVQRRDAAGTWTVWGGTNAGTGLGQFDGPLGVAADSAGCIYVADLNNNRIQKRDAGGTWTAWGSLGTDAGQFTGPKGVAVDAAGNLYVADTGNNRIQKRDTSGTWTTWGGTAYGAAVGQFNQPTGVATDAAGNLYVADYGNNRMQKRDTVGTWTAWGSYGTGLGQFTTPRGVATDAAGNVYVAEWLGRRLQKRDSGGNWTVLGSQAAAEGQLSYVQGVAVDTAGVVYVAEGNDQVRKCVPGLTFTTTNWNTPQTVTLAAAEDADAIDGTATLRCSATGWLSADVTATEADNDRQLVVSSTAVTVPEGGTQTFGVHLAAQPATDVTVTATRLSGDTDLTVGAGATLTFTASNWSTDQPVALAAAEDADELSGTAVIRVSATGWTSADVTATELDNDRKVVVSPTSVSVPEGGTNTFTVRLSSQPASDVTVAVGRVAGDTDIAVSSPAAAVSWTALGSSGHYPGQFNRAAGVAVDAVGAIYASDKDNARIQKRDPNGSWTVLAEYGTAVGQVFAPTGVAVDAAGNLFVADSGNNRVQKRDASGAWTAWGGTASGASLGQFYWPEGVAVDIAGNVYVAEWGNHRIQKRDTGGVWTVVASEGTALGQVTWPHGVTLDSAGNLYVAEGDNPYARIQKRDTGGNWTAWGSPGTGPGQFNSPMGVVVDAAGSVYVSDSNNSRLQQRDASGNWTVLATSGTGLGQFQCPMGLALDASGGLLVADFYNDRLQRRSLGGLTFTTANWNTPQTVTLAAAEDADAIDGSATIRCAALGWQSADVTATEADNDRQFVVSASSVSVPEGGTNTVGVHLAGAPAADVTVSVALLSGDADVSVTGGGSLTFTTSNWNVDQTVTLAAAEDADSANGTAVVRVSATGWTSVDVTATEADNDLCIVAAPSSVSVPEGGTNTFTVKLSNQPAGDVNVSVGRVAGDTDIAVATTTGLWAVWGSQGAGVGQLNNPTHVAVDAAGTLYVADANNHRIQRRDSAGNWTAWTSGYGQFNCPQGVTVDSAGNVYVADSNNDRLQRRDAGGTWTVWGSGGSADGQFSVPVSVTVDSAGKVYVADSYNHRVQKLDSNGAWLASWGSYGTALTEFNSPRNVAVDAAGSVYMADRYNHRIQKRDTSGTWTAIGSAGTALGQFSEPCDVACDSSGRLWVVDTGNHRLQRRNLDGTWMALGSQGSAAGQLNSPLGVALDAAGNVYVADTGNYRIQRYSPGLTFTPANWNTPQTITVAAAEDTDAVDGTATIRCEAPGWQSADVTATEADNDRQFVVSSTSVSVTEGGTQTFAVHLAGAPAADLTVSVARLSGDTDLSVSGGASLTFTPSNWSVDQTVTLAAASDADEANGTAVIRVSATGWPSADVTATESDTNYHLIATPSSVSVPEGGTSTFTVQLSRAPVGDVSVGVNRLAGDNDITVSSPGSAWTAWGGTAAGPAVGQFAQPMGVAVDGSGAVYVADTSNNRVQLRSALGTWSVLCTGGTAPGEVNSPNAVAVDPLGNLFVCDSGNNRIQRRDNGGAWTVWGGTTAGTAPGQFRSPYGVAAGADGVVYVADGGTNNRVQQRSAAGVWSVWSDVPGGFSSPSGVAVDAAGTVYVAEWDGGRVQRRTSGGTWTAFGSVGHAVGQLWGPWGVALDQFGTLYIAEAGSDRIQVRDQAGVWTAFGGTGTLAGQFNQPYGVAIGAARSIYVADSNNNRIQVYQPNLTFTAANWNTPQTVTLAAAEDADTVDGTATIRCSATGWTSADVTATEADNDRQLVVSSNVVTVPEGSTQAFGVHLAGAPAADTTVTVARLSGDADLTVSTGATLTFTTSNWSVDQTVTLAAAEDADEVNGTAVFLVSATGWPSVQVTATEADNDWHLIATPSSVSVPEGGSNTFTVQLSRAPASDVVVDATRVAGDADITVGALAPKWRVVAGEDPDMIGTYAGLATDAAGNIYLADRGLNRVERCDPSGRRSVWGCRGTAPGQFLQPEGVAVDASGNVYVADRANNRIQQRDANGTWTVIGGPGAAEGALVYPSSIAVDWQGRVYVVDQGRLQQRAPDGTWAVVGAADAAPMVLTGPCGVAVDRAGNLFVVANNTVAKRGTNGDWTALRDVGADGRIAVDDAGNVYVTDYDTNVVQKRDVAGNWTVWGSAGSGVGQFDRPRGVAVDPSGNVYVADGANNVRRIQKRDAVGTWTVWSTLGAADGQLYFPGGLAADSAGNLYVADYGNHRIQRRNADGSWTAWGDSASGSGVGQFFYPCGVAVDPAGSLYVGDSRNYRVQKRDTSGNWTAWGSAGSAAGQFYDPMGVAADTSGNVLVADSTNNNIQKRDVGGTWSILASVGTASGQVKQPMGLAVDSAGSLYVADYGNHRIQKRSTGGVWTVWGSQGGAIGQFNYPKYVAVDGTGNVYVTETGNSRIQKRDTSGTWTVLGSADAGAGQFDRPTGVAVDAAGMLYVADCGNHRIQKYAPGLVFTTDNWNTPQTITLSAAEDADAADGVATIRCSATGWTSADVTATEVDNDKQFVVSTTSVTVPEGGTQTFGVHLAAQPAGDTTVSVSRASGDADLSVSAGASLTFTTSNWSVDQTVTVAAAEDADTLNGVATIRCSATGWTDADVTATEIDNDGSGRAPVLPALVLSATSLTVPEGGTGTLGVKLSQAPGSTVEVAVGRLSGDADLSVAAGAKLSFTPSNWNVPQTATLAAAEDADASCGAGYFRVTATGGAATGWQPAYFTATEADNDLRLVATPSSLSVAEGSAQTFAVTLAGQPEGDVTVTVAKVSGDPYLTLAGAAQLTFTPANWNVPQKVTVASAIHTEASTGVAWFRASAAGWVPVDVRATAVQLSARLPDLIERLGRLCGLPGLAGWPCGPARRAA